MKQNRETWRNRAFVFSFLVLTFFVWCPLGYGAHGPVERILGVPCWAVVAVAFAAILFVLEWIYLFHTPLAMNDEDLPGVVSQLEAVDTDTPVPAKEDK